ncbi:MAG TPA: hypothetical protein VGK09_01830 [Rhodocyclaceae bacterium]|jgi:hypothetical protein
MDSTTSDETVAVDQQVARTIYLLSRAATVGVCRGRLRNVIRQLHLMTELPTLPREIRSTCMKVLDDWHKAELESFPDTAAVPSAALAH